jgi:hypothetical protein
MLKQIFRSSPAASSGDPQLSVPESGKSVYVFTIMKTGTHLIRNLLQELNLTCIDCLLPGAVRQIHPAESGGASSSFVLSHESPSILWRGSCQKGTAKIIFNLRDPRAVFLSLLDFYDWNVPLKSSGLHIVEFRRAACRAVFKTREELAMALIEDELFDDNPFTPWLNFRRSRVLYHHPNVLKVRFEELVACADRSARLQEHPVSRICRYLDLPPSPDPHVVIRRALAADSVTKNVGDPDRWRHRLPRPVLEAFMAKHGDIVREYGYPAQ